MNYIRELCKREKTIWDKKSTYLNITDDEIYENWRFINYPVFFKSLEKYGGKITSYDKSSVMVFHKQEKVFKLSDNVIIKILKNWVYKYPETINMFDLNILKSNIFYFFKYLNIEKIFTLKTIDRYIKHRNQDDFEECLYGNIDDIYDYHPDSKFNCSVDFFIKYYYNPRQKNGAFDLYFFNFTTTELKYVLDTYQVSADEIDRGIFSGFDYMNDLIKTKGGIKTLFPLIKFTKLLIEYQIS